MQTFERLESALCRWAGYQEGQVVACNSGTAALHLALEALQLPQGSQVIVPDFAMIACARAVSLAGLEPVFADCGEDLNLDPGQLWDREDLGRVRTILAIHTYGRRCDMDMILRFASPEVWGCYVIEDLAEAHGVKPHQNTDAACWSFYKNKIIHGEEGGAVAFKNPDHAAHARLLRNQGFTSTHDFTHIPRGHNYRLANLLAYPILESLRNVDENLKARRRIENLYNEYCPPQWRMPPRDVVWVYDIRIPGLWPTDQDRIVAALQDEGIAARHSFKPLSSQPEYVRADRPLPKMASIMSREVIYLPVITEESWYYSCREAFQMIHQLLGH